MAIKWLVQDTARMYSAIEQEFKPLNELGYDTIPFGVIPFTNDMTGVDDLSTDDFYIIRGGTKIVKMLEDGTVDNLKPELVKKLQLGISYNKERFDQAFYSNFNLPLLNSNPIIMDLSESSTLSTTFNEPKFIKPSSDLKAFTASIIEAGISIQDHIENGYYNSEYRNETVLIHDVLSIDSEYRFICINGSVITGSQYRRNNQLILNSYIPSNVLTAAKDYATIYQPSDIYTMDLAETPKGIKIVEYNCWNGSGLYHMDVKKLFSTINDYYKGKF